MKSTFEAVKDGTFPQPSTAGGYSTRRRRFDHIAPDLRDGDAALLGHLLNRHNNNLKRGLLEEMQERTYVGWQ